jgi:hypothetical protein
MTRPRSETVTEQHIREAIRKLSVDPTESELADLDKLVELAMKEAGVSEEYVSGVDLGKKRNKAWEVLQEMKEAGDTQLVVEGQPEDYLSTRDVSQAGTRDTSRSETREASPERTTGGK